MAQNIVFRVVADTQPAVDGMNKLDIATKNTKKDVNQLDQALGKIGAMAAGAFALGSVIQFGKEVYAVTNEVNSLNIRMSQLQGTADATDRAMGMLVELSKRLGVNMNELTGNYVQFVSAAKASGVEVAKAEKIFVNMTTALRGTGASADATKRAMTALTQMMGKGTIMSEELKGQLGEAMPQAIGWMAESLGVGTKQLFKMMEQGKLTSESLLGFSEVAVKSVGGSVDAMSKTMEANVARLSNSWQAYMASLGQRFYGAGGGAEVLSNMLDWWMKINASQDQYIKMERQRLLGDSKQQEQVSKEIELLRERKISEDEIIETLQKERDLNFELVKTGKNRYGVEQNLSNELKINILSLVNAYDQQIKLIKEGSDAKKADVPLTEAQIKTLQKEAQERIKVAREMKKALEDVYKTDGKVEVDPFTQVGLDLRRERRNKELTEAEETAKMLRDIELSGQEKEIADRKAQAKRIAEVEKDKRQMMKDAQAELYMGLTNLANQYYKKDLSKQSEVLQKRLEAGQISEEGYAQAIRKIKRKEMVADKIAALSQIAINTAINISSPQNALALGALTPAYLTNAAIQSGLVLAQPMPYNKGTKRVPMMRGAVRGRDSVHAILTPDERVVPADINTQPGYSALLDLAQDKKISDKEAGFLAELATSGMRRTNTSQTIDPDTIGRAIAKYIPHTNVAINERGIAVITERSQTEIRRLRRRIS